MEEGWEVGQPRNQDEYVVPLVFLVLPLPARVLRCRTMRENSVVVCHAADTPGYCTEKQLLEMIALQIQMLKPDNVPKPPYNVDSPVASRPSPRVMQTGRAAHETRSPAYIHPTHPLRA
ncbi:hypothetical protein NUW54_g14398 [Trametes sanguinea]|uniref:Uncharacterized protein n=1 Tax=Trametes sanguinea TaxID=158606 RepID=A0ACC1MEN9_9APHY|nr:hypothetical protein NUW54_g14398 [Trametes sanguinea]